MTKKKSLFSWIIALLLMLPCMFALTACGDNGGTGGTGGTGGSGGGTGGSGAGLSSVVQTVAGIKEKLGNNYKVAVSVNSNYGDADNLTVVFAEADNYFYYETEASKTLINTTDYTIYNFDEDLGMYVKNALLTGVQALEIMRETAYETIIPTGIMELSSSTPTITTATKLDNRATTLYTYNEEGATIKYYIDNALNICIEWTSSFAQGDTSYDSSIKVTQLALAGVSLQEEIALIGVPIEIGYTFLEVWPDNPQCENYDEYLILIGGKVSPLTIVETNQSYTCIFELDSTMECDRFAIEVYIVEGNNITPFKKINTTMIDGVEADSFAPNSNTIVIDEDNCDMSDGAHSLTISFNESATILLIGAYQS